MADELPRPTEGVQGAQERRGPTGTAWNQEPSQLKPRRFPRTRNSGAVGAEPSVNPCHQHPENVTLTAPSPASTTVATAQLRVPPPRWEMPPLAPTCALFLLPGWVREARVELEKATTPALPVLVALPGTFPVLQTFGG